MSNKWYCIYRITNTVNGKTYIGQHLYSYESDPMCNYYGSGIAIRAAINKHGKEYFTKEVLYQRIRDRATANSMEMFAIAKYKPEYNISKGGQGGNLSMFWTVEGRQKCISRIRSPEVRARANASQKGRQHNNVGILEYWSKLPAEQRKERGRLVSEARKRYWSNISPDEKAERMRKLREAKKQRRSTSES